MVKLFLETLGLLTKADDAGPRWHVTRDPDASATSLTLNPRAKHKGDLLPGFVSAMLSGCDWATHTQTHFDVISVCIAADRSLAEIMPIEVEYV